MHHAQQDAFAQAAIGDADALARERAADRLEDRAAGQHQIGALAADAGIRRPGGIVHLDQAVDHCEDIALMHPQPVDLAPVVARQVEMDAGDRGDRAGGAEQVEAAGVPGSGGLLGEGCQRLRAILERHRLGCPIVKLSFAAAQTLDTSAGRPDASLATVDSALEVSSDVARFALVTMRGIERAVLVADRQTATELARRRMPNVAAIYTPGLRIRAGAKSVSTSVLVPSPAAALFSSAAERAADLQAAVDAAEHEVRESSRALRLAAQSTVDAETRRDATRAALREAEGRVRDVRAALRAAEEMAREVGDSEFAAKCRKVFEAGSRLTVERLFNGEYFVQEVDLKKHPKHQYGDGCLSDQLFGQGWAHQVGLGYLYPREKVLSALRAVYVYNWAPDIGPQNAAHPPQRWFARPGEAGLFTCTWPKSKHLGPDSVLYRDEVWTGIEPENLS